MGSIWIILLILAVAAGVIAALILRNRKQKERQQYYDAACRIVQEEYLNKVLRNIPWEDTDLEIRKTMICLKEEHKKEPPLYLTRSRSSMWEETERKMSSVCRMPPCQDAI